MAEQKEAQKAVPHKNMMGKRYKEGEKGENLFVSYDQPQQ